MFKIFVLFNAFLLINLAITDEHVINCVKTGWEVEYNPYKAFVARAVAKANKESNNTYQFVDLDVINVMVEPREEVYLYEVTILAGQTNCAKNPKMDYSNCVEVDRATRKKYKYSECLCARIK